MVTTDNAISHGQISIIINGIKHNLAGIVHLAHHGSSGGISISIHHKLMIIDGSRSGSSDNRGPEPGGKASNGNNVHNKGNLRKNHPLNNNINDLKNTIMQNANNNNINDLKNTIMQNANKQLKIRGVQLPLPLPFLLP
jgi:hypothetical protein